MKKRLDKYLVEIGEVTTRSQAESYIRLGKVKVDGEIIRKPGYKADGKNKITLDVKTQYVSRAAMKLESINEKFGLDFRGKTVLDVGSSTGGFTDFAIKSGAKKAIGVEKGKKQMHPKLRSNLSVELHENTDIRDYAATTETSAPDIVLIDVSFISIREVLRVLPKIISPATKVIAMVKPQFESSSEGQKHKGVIKNEAMRRQILSDFEQWASERYQVLDKADSAVKGEKGNRERFYKLALLPNHSAGSI